MQQLEAMLQPQRIRATLSFAGLYQITHEIIKQSVPEEVRLFYRQGFDETGCQYDEEEYKRRVSEWRAQGSVQGRLCCGLSTQRRSRWPKLIAWTPSTPTATSCHMS